MPTRSPAPADREWDVDKFYYINIKSLLLHQDAWKNLLVWLKAATVRVCVHVLVGGTTVILVPIIAPVGPVKERQGPQHGRPPLPLMLAVAKVKQVMMRRRTVLLRLPRYSVGAAAVVPTSDPHVKVQIDTVALSRAVVVVGGVRERLAKL